MNLKPVTSIPGRKVTNNSLISIFKEFMNMDCQIVEIDPIKEGYKHANSLASCFLNSLKSNEYKGKIKIIQRNGKIYIKKIGAEDV